MVRLSPERILVVGDADREVRSAVASAAPNASIVNVPSVFDAVAELHGADFSAVFVAAEPIERRPDAAVRTLRDMIGVGRLFLFGHPTLEVLSRKMLEHGCDDYIIMPPDASMMKKMLAMPLRIAATIDLAESDGDGAASTHSAEISPKIHPAIAPLFHLPLAEMLLQAQLQHPHDAPAALINDINARLPASTRLHLIKASDSLAPDAERQLISQPVPAPSGVEALSLHLLLPHAADLALAQQAMHAIVPLLTKLVALQDRHNRLQRLAVTDELTGLYNGRYFRHFLSGIIERARQMQFTVSLLLFDIDDFKHYNDKFGHGIGDEILRQTATLMRRCCRDHDLVARIGGDEFAVVFWEKEGPRTPREPMGPPPPPGHLAHRRPQTPIEIFKRFKRLIETEDFSGLGSSGRGKLGISAGMASFPWNATDANSLIKAADEALMFGAKQTCKNTIYLVGGSNEPTPE